MERKEKSFDLSGLAQAFRRDLGALAGAKAPALPFAGVAAAVRELGEQAKEVGQQAVTDRRRHLEARAEVVAQPLVERREAIEQRVERRQQEIGAAAKDGFVVAGRVVDAESGVGLADVAVRVLERDPLKDDLLGEVRTDEMGFYRQEYRRADFKDLFERRPETYIRIFDGAGRELYTSDRSFRHKAGKVEILHAAVDGGRLPEALALGREGERRAAAELAAVARQARSLDSRRLIRAGLTPGTAAATGAEAVAPSFEAAAAPVEAAAAPDSGIGISRVKGVGPVLRSRLEARGVTDAAALAAMPLDDLADVLQVPRSRAEKIGEEARRLVG